VWYAVVPIYFDTAVNCTKFGKLILRKITEIAVTRCHILKLKCAQFDFGWGSASDPAGRAYRESRPSPILSLT